LSSSCDTKQSRPNQKVRDPDASCTLRNTSSVTVRPQGGAAAVCVALSVDLVLKHNGTAAGIVILAPLYFDEGTGKEFGTFEAQVALSPRTLGFDPRPGYVRFVVHIVALGQVYLRVLFSSTVKIIPSCFIRIHSLITDAISS